MSGSSIDESASPPRLRFKIEGRTAQHIAQVPWSSLKDVAVRDVVELLLRWRCIHGRPAQRRSGGEEQHSSELTRVHVAPSLIAPCCKASNYGLY